MASIEGHDPAVGAEVSSVATRMIDNLAEVSIDMRDMIAQVFPELIVDERVKALLGASVQENVNTVLHVLQHEIAGTIAPNAALELVRLLAQRNVDMTLIVRAYRLSQTQFQRNFITELLRKRTSDHVEGKVALSMVDTVSAYYDNVVEQVIGVYEQARDEWMSRGGAVRALRVRRLLREPNVGLADAQMVLAPYRIAQYHLGAVIWCDDAHAGTSPLTRLSWLTARIADAAECTDLPLFIPFDELTAWVWFPFGERAEIVRTMIENVVADADADVFIALGEPLASLVGFRRTYQQAELARAVALASEPASRLTVFSDVAPISTMPSDLGTTRAWIAETLGDLAVDDDRAALLRETARVFLAAGGSFTAAAQEMTLHRNTAQYRIRKAEELRGRPLREGRLDVELALLACHYFGKTVLQPPLPEGEHR